MLMIFDARGTKDNLILNQFQVITTVLSIDLDLNSEYILGKKGVIEIEIFCTAQVILCHHQVFEDFSNICINKQSYQTLWKEFKYSQRVIIDHDEILKFYFTKAFKYDSQDKCHSGQHPN